MHTKLYCEAEGHDNVHNHYCVHLDNVATENYVAHVHAANQVE